MAEVKRTNPTWGKFIEQKIKDLGGSAAQVGFYDNATYPSGEYVAYIASIQEYGSGKIPPRLGMRSVIEDKKNTEWKSLAKSLATAMLSGKKSCAAAMEIMGSKAESDFKDHIESSPPPPLSELTLALRYQREQGKKITGTLVGKTAARLNDGQKVGLSSNTKALDDTHTMLDHLTHNVVST